MLSGFCKRARTKPHRKPADKGARLRRLSAPALGLERTFGQAVTVAHIGHDLLERRGLTLCLPFGEHLLQEILLPDHPAVRLPAVEHLRMPLASACVDKDRKALPGRPDPLAELSKHPVCRKPRQVFLAEVSAVTAPRIGIRVLDHSRAHRIQVQVAHQRQAIAILIHQESLEPSLEHVPHPLEAGIEITGIAKRQILHACRQFDIAHLQSKVEMIGHQAEGVHPIAESGYAFGEQFIEVASITGREEHVLPGVAAQDDVVQTAGDMETGFTSHVGEDT